MENKMIIKTFLPVFAGFYGTREGAVIDDEIERAIDYYNEINETDYNSDNFRDIDYSDLQNQFCVNMCEYVEEKAIEIFPSLSIEFENVYSPKQYNFSNDSIDIKLHVNDSFIADLISKIKEYESEFRSQLKDTYTSCDGFISSYSNNINDWYNMLESGEKLEHVIGTCLEFLISVEIGFDEMDYYEFELETPELIPVCSDCGEIINDGDLCNDCLFEQESEKAIESFKSGVLPHVIDQYGEKDICAINTAFNEYTDALNKDGEISDYTYNKITFVL